MKGRTAAEAIFLEGVKAVRPEKLIPSALSLSGNQLRILLNPEEGATASEAVQAVYDLERFERIIVTGAGKASAAMAASLEAILGERISGGLIAVKYGHELPLKRIRQIAAAHPVPDERSLEAGREIRALMENATAGDLVICLFSGGASSLMADCPEGISLQQLQQTFDLLLRSGAGIAEVNCVRKHLSTLKGGQLARLAQPASLLSLIISDVIGDDPGVIASGPLTPDTSTFAEACAVIGKYGLREKVPPPVWRHLQQGREGLIPETPKPGDRLFDGVRTHVLGSNRLALGAAAKEAARQGYLVRIVREGAEGAAGELARFLAGEALNYKGPLPACLLMGGESTVEVHGEGRGGRNQHLALQAALSLEEAGLSTTAATGPWARAVTGGAARTTGGRKRSITVLSAGTDGTDGPTDMAGAVVDASTLREAREKGLDAQSFLEKCDSYGFFRKAGGHIRTGPTQTNVMDIMLALVEEGDEDV